MFLNMKCLITLFFLLFFFLIILIFTKLRHPSQKASSWFDLDSPVLPFQPMTAQTQSVISGTGPRELARVRGTVGTSVKHCPISAILPSPFHKDAHPDQRTSGAFLGSHLEVCRLFWKAAKALDYLWKTGYLPPQKCVCLH